MKFYNRGGIRTITYFVGPVSRKENAIKLKETSFKYFESKFVRTNDSTLLIHLIESDGAPIQYTAISAYCEKQLVGDLTDSLGNAKLLIRNCGFLRELAINDLSFGLPIADSIGSGKLSIRLLDLPGNINNTASTRRDQIRFKTKKGKLFLREDNRKVWVHIKPVDVPDDLVTAKDYLLYIAQLKQP